MRRTGYLLVIVASIFLFDGCSGGSSHEKHDEDAPVVQDLKIESDTPSAESSSDE